jgi:hypothetical protein
MNSDKNQQSGQGQQQGQSDHKNRQPNSPGQGTPKQPEQEEGLRKQEDENPGTN